MKDIGGYIELMLAPVSGSYHPNAIALNSARNGLVYAVKAYNIDELWVPYYTCPVVWQALQQAGCKLKFYSINEQLLPAQDFSPQDYILYTNYFGICQKQVEQLATNYPRLLVDNAQAFFASPTGIASVYSPRKFFGVPDGGYLYCQRRLNADLPQDHDSYKRFSHLLMRVEGGADFGYADFNRNDDSLIGQEVKQMSNLTRRLLDAQDYEKTKQIRLNNFHFLHRALKKYNPFPLPSDGEIPMYYPILLENDNLRPALIKNHIYLPACWRNLESQCADNSYELYLKKYLFLLIIDQRYDTTDMQHILEIIQENLA